jgi:hypothetical protein
MGRDIGRECILGSRCPGNQATHCLQGAPTLLIGKRNLNCQKNIFASRFTIKDKLYMKTIILCLARYFTNQIEKNKSQKEILRPIKIFPKKTSAQNKKFDSIRGM